MNTLSFRTENEKKQKLDATAKLSHHGSDHNTNMRMVFLHNLADALGSVGVIISGLCVMWFGVYFVDGLVALMIAAYMIYQSVVSFPKIVNILMNAAPEGLDLQKVKDERIASVSDFYKEGDTMWVKCLGTDNRGKVKLSAKRVNQETGEDLEHK